MRNLGMTDLVLTESQKRNYALIEIEKLLNGWNKSLVDYPPMPILDGFSDHILVIDDVQNKKGGLFFVYGYGGTWKTFLWKTMSAALNVKRIKWFVILISVNKDSTYNIKQGTQLAELIVKEKVIIWDEALMRPKHCFEALDRTMRNIMRFSNHTSSSLTFGGKTVVLGGEFRKIIPVIPKRTRQDIVQASINSSYLWNSCEVLCLTKDLRLRNITTEEELEKLDNFAKWIADLGDGKLGENNNKEVQYNYSFTIRIAKQRRTH
ncbi:uncharacterized protein LOC116023361 [Ipomoea triloba]|uniref:uncharacterized protein LOC116023361 n=1 Tax=Ipomoea triloba TaxID=35885 RepID=UPI00125D97F8|nr:uncharacterized protein LOC116023361 [Ipomoea triloba]